MEMEQKDIKCENISSGGMASLAALGQMTNMLGGLMHNSGSPPLGLGPPMGLGHPGSLHAHQHPHPHSVMGLWPDGTGNAESWSDRWLTQLNLTAEQNHHFSSLFNVTWFQMIIFLGECGLRERDIRTQWLFKLFKFVLFLFNTFVWKWKFFSFTILQTLENAKCLCGLSIDIASDQ